MGGKKINPVIVFISSKGDQALLKENLHPYSYRKLQQLSPWSWKYPPTNMAIFKTKKYLTKNILQQKPSITVILAALLGCSILPGSAPNNW